MEPDAGGALCRHSKGVDGLKSALPERAIERQIEDLLRAHQWNVERSNQFVTGGAIIVQGSTRKGFPDLWAWKALGRIGLFSLCLQVFIEVKRPGAKLMPEQERCHAEIRAAGGTVLVLHSLEECAEAFGIRL